MRERLLLLFAFLFFAALPQGKAQILGGEIDYQVLSQDKINVDITLYANANVVLPSRFYLTLESEETSNYERVMLTSTEGSNLSNLCESACKNSSDPNCGNDNQIVSHILSSTVLLAEKFNSSDCNILLSLRSYTQVEGRTESITLQSTFNRCAVDKNSSPSFNFAPTYLIPGNQIYSYDHSAIDSDGDSLYYSLTPSITYNNFSKSYDQGLNYSTPFYYLGYPRNSGSFPKGFNFDNATGMLAFVATKYQSEQLAVKVEEFRNGQKIGEKTRDVTHKIFDSENKTPFISGVNGNLKTDHTLCVGTEECITIEIFDKNKDNLKTNYSHNLSGAKFSLNNKNGNQELEICYTPKQADIGKQFFIKIHTEDDGCTFNLAYDQLIVLNIANSFSAQAISNISGCGEVSFNAKPIAKNPSIYSYNWKIDGQNVGSDQTFKQVFEEHGNHSLELNIVDLSTNCKVQRKKAFKIPSKPIADAGTDFSVCANEDFTLNASGGDKVKWLNIDNSSEIHNRTIETQLTESKTFELQVVDKYGCKDFDEIEVSVDKVDLKAQAVDPVICEGTPARIELKGAEKYTINGTEIAGNKDAAVYYETFPNSSGNLLVNAENELGCKAEGYVPIEVDNDCVWPGDPNGDAKVNNEDILFMGLAYNLQGPAQSNARENFDWKPLVSANWNQRFDLNQRDFKHADANNDGSVDKNDLAVFDVHYDKTIQLLSATGKNETGALTFMPDKKKAKKGDTVTITILMGSESKPAVDIHGVAFTISYDDFYVKDGKVNFITTESWLGEGGKTIEVVKVFNNSQQQTNKPKSQIEVGYSRTDRKGKSGWGIIGRLKFVVTDNIDLGKDDAISFKLSNGVVATSDSKTFSIPDGIVDIDLDLTDAPTSSIKENNNLQIGAFPNPTHGDVAIALPQEMLGCDLVVYNQLGEEVMVINNAKEIEMLDLSALKGFAIVKAVNNKYNLTTKLIIQ